jgi:preprotein translocase subunit SecG
MLTFLLIVHAVITAILVGVILMQRSEGGGLGMGGSPTGLMSARGAADFLTRATTVLATLFVLLSISIAVVASRSGTPGTIDTSLKRAAPPPAPAVPMNGDPLAIGNATAPVAAVPVPANQNAPVPTPQKPDVQKPVAEKPVASRPAPKPDRPSVVPTATPSAPRTVPPADRAAPVDRAAPAGTPGNAN